MGRPQIIDTNSILDGALRVFGRFGFRRTSMDAIAAECGISRPALYLRFATKQDLFLAVGRRSLTQIYDSATTAAHTEDSLVERLTAALSAKLDFLEDNVTDAARSELIGEGGIQAAALAEEFAVLHRELIAGILADGGIADATAVADIVIDSAAGIALRTLDPDIARDRIRRLVVLVAGDDATTPPRELEQS